MLWWRVRGQSILRRYWPGRSVLRWYGCEQSILRRYCRWVVLKFRPIYSEVIAYCGPDLVHVTEDDGGEVPCRFSAREFEDTVRECVTGVGHVRVVLLVPPHCVVVFLEEGSESNADCGQVIVGLD